MGYGYEGTGMEAWGKGVGEVAQAVGGCTSLPCPLFPPLDMGLELVASSGHPSF